jgi:DNA topoisomerase-1
VERFRGRFGELKTWAQDTLRTTRTRTNAKPTRDLALAAISTIMIKESVRVGCEAYTKRKQSTKVLPSGKTKTIRPSFGASSLRKEHVEVHGDKVRLHFWGKSGVYWDRTIQDADLARTVSLFLAQPGERLWRVPGKNRGYAKVTEGHVEQLFHRYQAKPKDLRTMLANDLFKEKLGQLPRPTSKRQAKRNLTGAIKEVAEFMGHKPSTCRTSYLERSTLEQYTAGLR